MLENRSFDHMMGFMKQNNSKIDGCLPGIKGCSNPEDPTVAGSPEIPVSNDAVYVQISDPHHDNPDTTQQIYGYGSTSVDPAPMTGFVKNYPNHDVIMKCFDPTEVPAITTLASEFALFDRWYSAVPGPTEVNRLYVNSATSDGSAGNDDARLAYGYPQKPIFESLDLSKYNNTWASYFELAPTTLFFKYTRTAANAHKLHDFHEFWQDAAAGNLANYVWLEPNYFSEGEARPANDEHPDHDVSLGDKLIADVYSALRNGPLWNKTLFIVTYDEHGGFFDHVSPPINVPNPDGKPAFDVTPPFYFTREGVRVPTIMASPWIPKGQLIHEPQVGTHYEHSSVCTTIRKWFAPDQPFLTKRDSWATSFDDIVSLSAPRTDCPTSLPIGVSHRDPKYGNNGLGPLSEEGSLPLTGFGKSIATMCAGLDREHTTDVLEDFDVFMSRIRAQLDAGMTEAEGARLCRRAVAAFKHRAQALTSQTS